MEVSIRPIAKEADDPDRSSLPADGNVAKTAALLRGAGLITPSRCANGPRHYHPRYVDRVLQIRGLLDAGLPGRIVKEILPCLDSLKRSMSRPPPQMLSLIEEERDLLTSRIDSLRRNRDTIANYLAGARTRNHLVAGGPLHPPSRTASLPMTATRTGSD